MEKKLLCEYYKWNHAGVLCRAADICSNEKEFRIFYKNPIGIIKYVIKSNTRELKRKPISKDLEIKLMNELRHNGQLDIAIITCDGFLINGNRLKNNKSLSKNKWPSSM